MRDQFEKLGRAVSQDLPRGADDARRRRQEARLLAALDEPRGLAAQGRRWRVGLRRPVAAAVAAAAAAALIVWAPWSSPPGRGPLCIQRGGGAVASGAWIDAAESAPATLDFKDGSELATEGPTRLQLRRVGAEGVQIVLRRGKVRSRIRPRGRRWSFEAGPYRTVVLGTSLSVQWRPEAEHLLVGVRQGRVRVKGGAIGGAGMVIEAGQRLEVRGGKVRLHPGGAPPRSPDGGAGPHDHGSADATPPSPDGPPRAAGQRLSMRWRDLARQGRHRAALRAALAQGYGRLLQGLRGQDLLLLADAARLAGDHRRARKALLSCRRRFPKSGPARQAAFRLGRLAFEAQGRPGEAARWFRRFIKEAPGSPLREPALGRLMLALERGGKKKAAAEVAGRYLLKYPKGAYAAAARRCLEAR